MKALRKSGLMEEDGLVLVAMTADDHYFFWESRISKAWRNSSLRERDSTSSPIP